MRRFVVFVAAVSVLVPTAARAACNLIPVARKEFPSVTGSVASPITAPGKPVEIRVTACDASPGFESVAAMNEVTIRFEPPGGGADTDHVIATGVSVSGCGMGGRCDTLSFTTPDDLELTYPPNGLAGPARVIVRDSLNAIVAEIGELYLPTTGCDRTAETVFNQFTVLPKANSFADAAAQAVPELLATLDGGGNLLVPFDYWGDGGNSVLAEAPGAPVARILDGSITLDAFTANPGIALQIPSSDFVRSFTLDGRPLPPLLRSNATGDLLFGSADAAESVLRIARNVGGGDIYDLTDRLSQAGRGPIVIDDFALTVRTPAPLRGLRTATDVVTFARDESEEGDLNGDADTADRIVQIIDGETGAETSTSAAVVESQTGAFLLPALDTEDASVAFLELDPLFENFETPSNAPNSLGQLQVRLADGTVKTAAVINGDPAPAIEGRPLRLSDGLVFMLQREPSLGLKFEREFNTGGYAIGAGISRGGSDYYAVRPAPSSVGVFRRDLSTGDFSLVQELFNNQDGVFGIGSATGLGLTFDNRNLYVAGASDDGLAVFDRDETTGLLTFADAHIDGVAGVDGLDGARFPSTSYDGKNVYVCGADEGKLAVFQRDLMTGALTFLESHADAGLAHCTTAFATIDGEHVYVAAGLGSPIHGAVSVYTRNPGDGSLTFVETHFDDSAGGIIDGVGGAVSAVPSFDGEHVYVGGLNDSAIAIFDRNPLTGELTFVDALFDGVDGIEGLGSANGAFPDPDNEHVYALGPADDTLSLFDRDAGTGLLTVAEQYVDGVDGVSGMTFPTYGGLEPSFRELLVSSTSGGTGALFRVPSTLEVFDVSSGMTRIFPQTPARKAAVAAGRAIVLTPEDEKPSIANADADDDDDIVQIYDGANDVVTSLALAGRDIAISADLAAFTNPETQSLHVYPLVGGVIPPPAVAAADMGAVGVAGSKVAFTAGGPGASTIRVYDHDAETVDDLERRADEFVMGDSLVAFRTPESAGGADLNGDGDILDSVMHVYDLDTATVTSTGQASVRCDFGGCNPFLPYVVRGRTVSFVTREQDQGGKDLNGDGDSIDTVMQVFDVASRVLQVIDLSSQSPTLSPFPVDFADGVISFVQTRESDLGEDIDGDGFADDVVVLLAADSDQDGVFDDADLCLEDPSEAGRDTDLDGLGDGCDPTPLCSDFTPAAPPAVAPDETACQATLGKSAAVYLKNRVKASQKCLDSLANAKLSGDPIPVCVGGMIGGGAAAPSYAKTAVKIRTSEAKLRAKVATSCGGVIADLDACADTTDGAAACVSAVAARVAENVLRQAYGELGSSTPASALTCQKTVGKAAGKYVSTVVKAIATCLKGVADGSIVGDPTTLCLGAISAGPSVVLPSDAKTMSKLTKAESALRDAIADGCSGGELASLDGCAGSPDPLADCLLCTTWRHALALVRAVYGPQ